MTYHVKSFSRRTKQTRQPCDFAFTGIFLRCSSYFRAAETIWHIAATSASLCPRSSEGKRGVASSGGKDCLYSQASHKSGRTGARICKVEREVHQRPNRSSPGACSEWWRGAWLEKVVFTKLRWNTAPIALQLENFLKSINNYCLIELTNRNLLLVKG